MKKNLLIVGLLTISVLVMGQKSEKAMNSKKISEFKNRMILSTAKDPMAFTKTKTIKKKDFTAQQLVKPLAVKKNKLKSANSPQVLSDTSFTYLWDAGNQAWDTVPVAKLINYYDDQQNVIQYLALTWSPATNDWMDSIQFFYKYNSANKVLDVIQQMWMFDGISNYSWVNVDNSVTEYNSLGQQSKFLYQSWDYGNSIWDLIWQHEFTYDSIGNNTLIVESYWDGDSKWIPGINFISKFDTLNHIVLNLIQCWNYDSNDWSNAYQSIYTNDKSGNNVSVLSQLVDYDSGLWDNYLLETLNYNKYNKIDNYLFQLWDPYLFVWTYLQRAFYKYDSIGNNTCIVGQDYDPSNDTWSASWVSYYDYNAQNKQISYSSLYSDASSSNSYSSGTKTKTLKSSKQKLNNVNLTSNLLVYPNPVIDLVNIQSGIAITDLILYDIQGHEIMNKNYSGQNTVQIDISGFNTGIYFLKIKNSDGSSATRKVVKK